MKRINIQIKGMDCSGCAKTIEKALLNKEGLISSLVNFNLGKAIVEYDPEKIREDQIKKIIKDAGYGISSNGNEIDDEIKNGWQRFWVGLFLTVPVFIISTFFYSSKWNIPLFLLATPVQIILGFPFYRGAYFSLKQKTADMNVLVSLSTLTAFVYSLVTTFFISGSVFYDASSAVLTTITLGTLLEKISKGKVGEAIKKLMKLEAKSANILKDDKEIEILSSEIKKGEIIIVRPGEKIATDGIVVEGDSAVDESMITGEYFPIDKKPGDAVFGATINKSGVLKFQATRIGEETTLSQIIKLVEDAQISKAPIQRIADKIVSFFVPAVIIVAVLAFIIWYFFQSSTFLFALTALVSVLVISCPCALGIATPTAIMAGTGKGAENGILIRGGQYLEKVRELTTIVFDKTGTLTMGEPKIKKFIINSEYTFSEEKIIKIAAGLAKNSHHPLSKTVFEYAKTKNIEIDKNFKNFQELPGRGIIAVCEHGEFVALGNKKLLQERKVNTSFADKLLDIEDEGTYLFVLHHDKEIIGAFVLVDEIKAGTKEAIIELKKMGLEIIMITGDNKKTAMMIGKELGIEKVLAEVLPQDKEKEIENLQKQGKIVGAVGDGINDAPMLARADIGIAMGAGTDIAKETGGIVLVKNDISDVIRAIKLSQKTFLKIKQNIFLAFIYNILAIPIAAGIFYHWFGFLLRPEIAALAMILSDISVIGNSLLLRRIRLK